MADGTAHYAEKVGDTQQIPFESNSLSHLLMLRFYALLEGFFLDALHLFCYSPLDGLHSSKTGLLDGPFELREKKKIVLSKIK